MGGLSFLNAAWAFGKAAARQFTALGWACVVAALLLVLLLATCSHNSLKDAQQHRRAAEERTKALDRARKSDSKAADDRLFDVTITYQREKELTDAVEALPDAVPSHRRIALACQRLRHQGTRDADLPASCRPDR